MNHKFHNVSFFATSLIGLLFMTNTVCAAPISGQGTWESTLQARDLDGDLNTIEAFYDTTLDITWLADAALSITESFGVSDVFSNGRLPGWGGTNDWIDGMNANNGYLDRTDWRLPTILDTSDLDEILGRNSDPSRSEMASLFYITLGNVTKIDENGNTNANHGLTNTALFNNFQAYYYWTGTPYNSTKSWAFAMHSGDQYRREEYARGFALPVLDGDAGTAIYDVATVPVPPAIVLFGSGLLGLIGFSKRKKA